MKKILYILILFYTSTLFANICSKCSYKNEPDDRYCLNCTNELRNISEEEQSRLAQINKERKEKVSKVLQKEAQEQIDYKRHQKQINNKKSNNKPPKLNSKHAVLHHGGVSIRIGMKKSLLRKKLDYSSGSYPYSSDKWRIYAKHQTSYLYFKDQSLTKWETTVTYDYYIKRNFPLDPNKLKLRMSFSKVESMWGQPDIKKETFSEQENVLTLEYYLNEPKSDMEWERRTLRSHHRTKLMHKLLKKGEAVRLTFDNDRKLISINKIHGEKREIEKPMMNPII